MLKIRIGLAATLVLAVLLALGPTGPSAAPTVAPTENAVIHWSGVAATAIAVGRPPASSAVLGGMVHGAMYDAVAAIEGGLKPFATGVTAPPGASADAAVAQAARDVLVARVPGQATTVQSAYDAYMASIPDGPAKDAGKAVGVAAAAGMLAMRTGDRFDDNVVRAEAGRPWRVRADRVDAARSTPSSRSCGRSRSARPRTTGPTARYELTSKRYAEDVAEVQAYGRAVSTVRTPFADRDRPLPHRADVLPVQPHRA